jgi:PAS domain S-box-containing protein
MYEIVDPVYGQAAGMSNRSFEFPFCDFSRFSSESCTVETNGSARAILSRLASPPVDLAAARSDPYLQEMIALFPGVGRARVLSAAGALIAIVAAADWYVGTRASLGLFYILPMMLGATVLGPSQIVAMALVCSVLRSLFDLPSPRLEILLRFLFAALAYSLSGLFVAALVRNRELALQHLERVGREQKLRRDAEEQLNLLVESSPAAIVTTDENGKVLASNNAAGGLFLSNSLAGRPIGDYVPLLANALRLKGAPEGFRTAAQCQGRRENGEIFLAQTWFSCYASPRGTRLAAIVVDVSEEMREREEEGLRQLARGNRIATAAVSHEIRNLCSAISLLCSNLKDKHAIGEDEDYQALATLAGGLERIASGALSGNANDAVGEVALRDVLDDLRIVIEPDWREIDGVVSWRLPDEGPWVLAERHGLLQAFLNLAKNSHRAVQEGSTRELRILVSVEAPYVRVRFHDSGPGVSDPERLFEPFQTGANGAGLGLYLSRAVVRGYGGELRHEPSGAGTCFRIDLPLAKRG